MKLLVKMIPLLAVAASPAVYDTTISRFSLAEASAEAAKTCKVQPGLFSVTQDAMGKTRIQFSPTLSVGQQSCLTGTLYKMGVNGEN
jgi:hypothetical protein